MTSTERTAVPVRDLLGSVPNAGELLRRLVGEDLPTVTGAANRIIDVRPPNVIVATGRSPQGRPVPIAWVEQALHRLATHGMVSIKPAEIGYRSAFIGAVLNPSRNQYRRQQSSGYSLEPASQRHDRPPGRYFIAVGR
jgi:hypothetical protein